MMGEARPGAISASPLVFGWPRPAIALATSAFAESVSSTMGRRVFGCMKPSRHKAYFMAAGLSLESAAVSGASRFCKYLADCNRPCRQLEKMTRHSSGATFEIADMQPSPPLAIKANAVVSSPDNSRNPGGTSDRKRSRRAISPVPSLNTMNCRDSASRARVSSDNSRTVREGMSCKMMGRAVEPAIA